MLSDRSKKGEVITMLTSRPDCRAPDSTAQACLGDIVALLDVSIISNPYGRDGKVASGSSVNTNDLNILRSSSNIYLSALV